MSASRQPNINQLQAGSGQLDQDSIPDALKKEIINQSNIDSRYNSINSNDDSSFSQQNYDDIINNYNLVGNFNTTNSDNTVLQYNNILDKIKLLTIRLNSVTTNNKKFMTNTKLRLKLILDRIYTTRLNLASIINNNNTEELRILRQRNADLTSKLTNLQSSCSATKDQLQNARQEIDRNNQRISELEKEKNRLTDELRSSQQKYATLNRQYQTLLKSRGDNAAEIDRLTQENLDLEEQMYEMQEQIYNLNMDIERKRQENQVLANRIAELELDLNSQITTHHNQLLEINKALDSGFNDAIRNLDNNNNEIENIMKVIKEIEDELDVFDRDITTASAGGAGGGAGASATSPIIPSSVPSVPSRVPTTGPDGVPMTLPLGVKTTVPSGVPSGASSGVPSGVVSAKGPDGVPKTVPSGVTTNNSAGGGGRVSNDTTSVHTYNVPRQVKDDELDEMQRELDPSSNRSDASNVSSVGQPLGVLGGPAQSNLVSGNQLESPSVSPPGSLTGIVNNDPLDSTASPVNPYSSDQLSTNNQVAQQMTATDTGPLLPPFTSKTTSTKKLSGSNKFRSVIDKYIADHQVELFTNLDNVNLKDNLNYVSANSEQIYNLATGIEPSTVDSISSDDLKTLVRLVKILIQESMVLRNPPFRLDKKHVTFMNEISPDEFKLLLIPNLENVLKDQKDRKTRNSELIRSIGTNMRSNKGGKMKTRMKRKRRKTQKKKK